MAATSRDASCETSLFTDGPLCTVEEHQVPIERKIAMMVPGARLPRASINQVLPMMMGFAVSSSRVCNVMRNGNAQIGMGKEVTRWMHRGWDGSSW